MTQPLPALQPESPQDSPTVPDRFKCQTDGCTQPFRLITIDVEESTPDIECMGCYLARNLAVLQGLAEQGLLDLGAQNAQPG